eukprot:CAMPEP_0202116912 /NCGR_PEP_ID=MMETSP0965-20130614/41700_1 /ASSEMBLY_ACC=CAM_ASM_000507 /TAXON_ID=4773 /ORGANISM="Schizochytrium aggregatum, Strain ATCC28209" /LENGTH=102 /DNA_ID=CAMNT_0048686793 /DNA_START=57 /DNA_END=361 /DNA_ORIENTATION=-
MIHPDGERDRATEQKREGAPAERTRRGRATEPRDGESEGRASQHGGREVRRMPRASPALARSAVPACDGATSPAGARGRLRATRGRLAPNSLHWRRHRRRRR